MSKYTTGEVAKLCDVTVRTVQYYDTRGILIPSELTEGGRRLYSEEDLNKLRVICFLRDLGIPINVIAQILEDENSQSVVSLLLDQHSQVLKAELDDCQKKYDNLEQLKSKLKAAKDFSVNSIGDIAHIMKTKSKLRKVRLRMIVIGLIMDAIEIGTAILWATTGIWWPFAVGMVLVVVAAIFLSAYYYKSVNYICPQCHEIFKPSFKQAFWANHTPNTRKLTCPHCDKKHWCVEVFDENSD